MLSKVHDCEFGWFNRDVRERFWSLSPEIRASSIEQYGDWKDTRVTGWNDTWARTIEDPGDVH